MGVTRQVLKEGNGIDKPKKGDTVSIHYNGTLQSGAKFDSSRDRGLEFSTKIGVGQVIKGWDEEVPEMSLGEKSILTITADHAYGDKGFPGLIPPGSTLVFEIELLGINNKRV